MLRSVSGASAERSGWHASFSVSVAAGAPDTARWCYPAAGRARCCAVRRARDRSGQPRWLDRRASHAVKIAELAVEKQAQTLLLPVSARRQLNDLPDDMWTKIGTEFYRDATDAVFKALVD